MTNDGFDRPIQSITDDQMARAKLMISIANTLVEKREGLWRATGACVAVSGKWGTGKTTLLNFVHNFLSSRNGVIVVRFEPWLVSNQTDTINAFFREMSRALGQSKVERAREVAVAIDEYRGAVAGVA